MQRPDSSICRRYLLWRRHACKHLDFSDVTALMVEYLCWQVHWDDWCLRQPTKRHIAFKNWVSEGRELFDQRDELKAAGWSLLRRGGHEPIGDST